MTQTQSQSTTTARFEGVPAESLADETVSLRISGFNPGARVTVRSRFKDDFDSWWEAANEFRADDRGVIDLASQAPESGSYTGVDSMGFLWSMTPVDPDTASPMMIATVEPKVVDLTAEIGGQAAASTKLVRRYLAPGVKRIEVRDDGLFGTLFVPPGDGPFPTIVLLSGSGGGLSEPQAALYAAHGYGALALAYFKAGHLPENLIRIPLEYFERAMAWLEARSDIDSDRLAVGGASRGGELSLLLGSRYPQFKAVVSNVPSAIVYGGFGGTDEAYLEPAWTHGGEPVPFFTSKRDRIEDFNPVPGVPFELTPLFLRGLEEEDVVREVAIPVEQINGPVLLISGKDDAMWPSTLFSEMVMSRFAERGHPFPDQHLAYAGVGHIIGQPWMPTTAFASSHPVSNTLYAYGGSAKESADARVDAWSKTLAFLDARFKSGGDVDRHD